MTATFPPNPAHLMTLRIRVDEVEHDDAAATATEVVGALEVLGYKDVEIIDYGPDLR